MNQDITFPGRNLITRRIGAAFWLAITVVAVAAWWFGQGSTALSSGVATPPLRGLFDAGRAAAVNDLTGTVEPGVSVFHRSRDGRWTQVGHALRVQTLPSQSTASLPPRRVVLQLYGLPAAVEELEFVLHQSSGRLEDILTTLVPEAKRQILIDRVAEAMNQHGEAITAAMLPIAMDTVKRSLPLIETQLRRSISLHRVEIEILVARYRQEIIEQRLVPLVQEEVLPVLRKHGQAPAESIGREIWERAPLFQLGWRAVYDQSPLPKRDLLRDEWERFVEQEVIPIVESHVDEIVAALQATLAELAASERIRDEFSAMAAQITSDPEALRLVRTIVREAIVDNVPLRQLWLQAWSTPAARDALRDAGRRLEPVIRGIADEVMGTRDGGIEPGFARLLRNQILGKDRTWITVEPRVDSRPTGDAPSLRLASRYEVYPIVHLAGPDNDALKTSSLPEN